MIFLVLFLRYYRLNFPEVCLLMSGSILPLSKTLSSQNCLLGQWLL